MSYNLSNAAWVSQQTGYSIESIVALAEVAKCLNIQFKIEGMPFGAEYSRPEGYGKTATDILKEAGPAYAYCGQAGSKYPV